MDHALINAVPSAQANYGLYITMKTCLAADDRQRAEIRVAHWIMLALLEHEVLKTLLRKRALEILAIHRMLKNLECSECSDYSEYSG